MWVLAIGFVAICVFWIFSMMGLLPLTYVSAKTPRGLEDFLSSPRENMRGIKVNGHFLELGVRPSVQILKDYNDVMFLMRPYREIQLQTRNLTRPEVFDFCTNITGADLEALRAQVLSGKGYTTAWSGKICRQKIELVKATMFSYLVKGLSDKQIFITQVELAKRLNMDDDLILDRLIPAQRQWYSELLSSSAMDKPYPVQYLTPMQDELIKWIDENKE